MAFDKVPGVDVQALACYIFHVTFISVLYSKNNVDFKATFYTIKTVFCVLPLGTNIYIMLPIQPLIISIFNLTIHLKFYITLTI